MQVKLVAFTRELLGSRELVSYVDLDVVCRTELTHRYRPQGLQPYFAANEPWSMHRYGERLAIVSPFWLKLSTGDSGASPLFDFYYTGMDAYPSDVQQAVKEERDRAPDVGKIFITNNPLVLNEFRGEDIRVILAEDPLLKKGGLTLHRLCDLPGYQAAMEIYQPGEWWLSRITGDYAEPGLLTGTSS